jgi:hypothetical protein
VDANNTSVSGGAALSVFYAAHANDNASSMLRQSLTLSASETYSSVIVTIKPPYFSNAQYDPQSQWVSEMPATAVNTFRAAKTALVPVASPTDIAVLSGNATNTVIPTKVTMQCTQTTAGIVTVQLLVRTTADSGGTSTGSPSSYPLDQQDVAAVSSLLTYTANPTVNDGTNRLIDSQLVASLGTAATTPEDSYIWTPSIGQSVVLRGTAQQLALNLNGTTMTGGSCNIMFQWMEISGY